MSEPGRAWAYFALFSEIGIGLLVTVLVGVLGGYWIGQQVGTVPIGVVIGLFVGLGAGSMYAKRIIDRFLARIE
jgi:F0F1-type ATP synthase assembly protein I